MATEERFCVVSSVGGRIVRLSERAVISEPVLIYSAPRAEQTMGLNRQEKADMIKEISEIVADTEGLVIAEFRGLTVDAATQLRAEARKKV